MDEDGWLETAYEDRFVSDADYDFDELEDPDEDLPESE